MIKLPEYVLKFMQKFWDLGYEIYVVGGAVRDALLGKTVDNYDFTTNALPEQILKLFPDASYQNNYGTVLISHTLSSDKRILFEVTTFRKESKYADFRHPEEVVWADTLKEDLERRDFTINAMAFDGKTIIDLFGGRQDLKNKIIRAVGDPDKRFSEDALRLIRAVRFASQLGFMIEPKTAESIKKNAKLIKNISWERIRDEFLKILSSDYPYEGVMFLHNLNLLVQILPEVEQSFSVEQKSPMRHHIYDVGTHLLLSLKYCRKKDPILRFAVLLHDIGKLKTYHKDEKTGLITFYNHEVVGYIMAKKIAKRFRLSKEQTKKLTTLVRFHQFTVSERQSDKAIRRFIRNVGKEYLEDMFELRRADRLGSSAKETSWRLELFKQRVNQMLQEPFTVSDLKIDGYDVMKILGISPGPKVGKVLQSVFEKVETKELPNDREKLLDYLNSLKKAESK
ncbi:MAG: HDIG domain-containing protein [Patescibacteria group bacterium]|nr:MAG: HDIG domain-containing protein [Patescibacteria group bacterium]